MDTALVLFLILLNGLFAMSEMALTASRKARLQVMVEDDEAGAQAAMDLHDNPTKFLSVVQIGITSIGVLNGIVGDAAFSEPLGEWLHATFNLSLHPAHITATDRLSLPSSSAPAGISRSVTWRLTASGSQVASRRSAASETAHTDRQRSSTRKASPALGAASARDSRIRPNPQVPHTREAGGSASGSGLAPQ